MIHDVVERARQDVLDCIGCNDCLIACPIPEKSMVSIAQLNEAVNQTDIEDKSIIDFVQACTQCQQCVPVCPAHLSRANMVLFNKMKVEQTQVDHPIPTVLQQPNVGEVSTHSTWTRDALVGWLKAHTSLSGQPVDILNTLVGHASICLLDFEEVLYRAGEYHEYLYILLDGGLTEVMEVNGSVTPLLSLKLGTVLGTSQVLNDAPCYYTVQSQGRSEVLRIHKAMVYRLWQTEDSFKHWIEELYRQQAFTGHLNNDSELASLEEMDKKKLFQAAELRMYEDGQHIGKLGEKVDGLWLIQGGFVKVVDKLRVLDYLGPGDELGVMSFIKGQTYGHDFYAVGKVMALMIPRRAYREVLRDYPKLREYFLEQVANKQDEMLQYTTSTPKVSNTTVMGFQYDNLGTAGLLGAKRLLVIDQQICNDCNACVEACEQRHGVPRLRRTGRQMGQYLFPSACRHCEDPKCLMCTVKGIVRKPTGEIVIDPEGSCIGCGSCAERCPYDNISMVKRTQIHQEKSWKEKFQDLVFSNNKVGGESFWESGSLFDLIRGRKAPVEQVMHTGPDCIATKCDLCSEYEHEACVQACPVGAAFRVTGEEVIEAAKAHSGADHE